MPDIRGTLTGGGDVALHVEDTGGHGRPVVLIHPWPQSGAAWKDNVPALQAAGYRVVTYDRRGFGESEKPLTGYTYDAFTDDLARLMVELDLTDVTLVGYSMGGGEVARYASRHGVERLHSVVFASAITPYMLRSLDNPDGPTTKVAAAKATAQLTANQSSFYDQFITDYFTAGDHLAVTEDQRQQALALCHQASKAAALETMAVCGFTDFRADLRAVTVPTLVIHGDSDGVVSFDKSGRRTHEAVPGSQLHVVAGGPHGLLVSHADEFNQTVIDFLDR